MRKQSNEVITMNGTDHFQYVSVEIFKIFLTRINFVQIAIATYTYSFYILSAYFFNMLENLKMGLTSFLKASWKLTITEVVV